MLNHSSTRFNDKQKVFYHNSFVNRYICPDGELTGTAKVMVAMTGENWEVFHEENLRHHYAKTLHAWRMNLEDHWDEAVTEVGERKSRVWRLYMAVSEFGFAMNVTQLHQFLGVNTTDEGVSAMPLRLDFCKTGELADEASPVEHSAVTETATSNGKAHHPQHS